MTTISDQITSLVNQTTQLESKTDTITGEESSNLDQSDFLKLLTEQLQFQDPLEPQDNSEFISQMCAFSQLNLTTNIDSTLSDYTGFMKANSVVGKDVVLSDTTTAVTTTTTNGVTSTTTENINVTGTVTSSYLQGSDSGIVVNGNIYSIDDLLFTCQD